MVQLKHYINEGGRIFLSSLKHRILPQKYYGSAEDICKLVVKCCWNGRFFQTSNANFSQFWTRDFGWCAHSLIKLGYEKEVQQTLRYALNNFQLYNKVTTTITPKGEPFDFPTQAVDSLPWLIHSIRVAKFPYHSYKNFLNNEILKYHKNFINQKGLVKSLHVSSIKDFAVRKSSCYDNCMVGMLAVDLAKLKLVNPFKEDYAGIIKQNFWSNTYFYDDLEKTPYVAGDANIFPFLTGVIKDKDMLESCVKAIEEEKLDRPFPLKYTSGRNNIKFIWQEKVFLKDYESNSIWMHMGLLYVRLLKEVNPQKAEEFKKVYKELIETNHNFFEVFSADGKPYKTPFYHSDSGMLWAANYLTL